VREPFVVKASAIIEAPAERVYAVIADYRQHHPRILPKPFGALVVESGGVGAGTVIRCGLRVLGRMQTFRAVVSEPEPGRVLAETIEGPPRVLTTFTVDGSDSGRSRVTIASEVLVRTGLLGALERYLNRRFLEPIYQAELKLLARVATEPADS
jgi:hypothetical protein